jgi:general secretion pathway protein C
LRLDNELRRLSPVAQRLGAVPLVRWRQLALLLLAAWILANLARLVWLLLPLSTPPVATAPLPINAAISERTPAANNPAVDIEQLVDWHLFGEVGATKPVATSAIEAQAQNTSLNLQLVGLVQSNDDKLARAILLLDGRQQQFAIGEQLPASGKVVLSKVLGDRAIIENNSRYETLWLYDQESLNKLGSTIQAVVPSNTNPSSAVDLRVDPTVTAAASGYRQQLYQNPSGLADLIQVSVQQDGFRIRPGRDPQAFAAFGLRPDDVVTAINGVSLNNPESALSLYNEMRTAQEATLTIRRGGEEVVIAVSLQGAAANAQ